jgi:LacI family transcriptional regulator
VATIYDVARRARVSTYTVSAVLNRSAYVSPELTQRVQRAVQDLDYSINEVARSLQTRRTRTVGMLIPDIAGPFYSMVVRGVEDRLKQDGYSLILGNTYNDASEQSRYLNLFRAKQADGILLFVAPDGEPEVLRLVEARKAVVFVGRSPSGFEADTVTADNVLGTRLAVRHLVSRRHKRIAIVTGHLSLSTSAERILGWREELKAHKLPAPKNWVAEGDWTTSSGYHAALRLLDLSNRPTAIFAANFLMMAGVLRALKERKVSVPAEAEVMSSDDSELLDCFDPPISTIVQPSYEMGRQAAILCLERIKNPARPFERITLTPALHLR